MAFNAYLVFHEDTGIVGESTSHPDKDSQNHERKAIEVTEYGFGVNMPVTTSRSDGGGATVGRAAFDPFTCSKGIDTATTELVRYCCKGTNIPTIVLHLYRAGEADESGAVKYAMVIFEHCVITKVTISGSGDELPKEQLEFNYGLCQYVYCETDHKTGKPKDKRQRFGWSTIRNKDITFQEEWLKFMPQKPHDV